MQFGVLTISSPAEGIGRRLGAALELSLGLVAVPRQHYSRQHAGPYGRWPSPENDTARTLDPFVALAAAAATQSLVVGTGIALIPERDPIVRPRRSLTRWIWCRRDRFQLRRGCGLVARRSRQPWCELPAVRGRESMTVRVEIWLQGAGQVMGSWTSIRSAGRSR